jgi:transposase-like protein
MKRRKWDAKTKATIVLEGLKGKPVTAICQDYQISQTQYYQWRDQFLSNAPKTFEVAQQTEREARLQHENARLKTLVGELTLELKKSDEAGVASRRRSPTITHRNAPVLAQIQRRPTIPSGGIAGSGHSSTSGRGWPSTRNASCG